MRRLIIFCVLVFLLAAGALVVGFTYIKQVVVPLAGTGGVGPGRLVELIKNPQQGGKLAFDGKQRMNILVLGIDYNYTDRDIHYTGGARSDTIMVVSLDSQARFLNVLSVPRDCRVLISPSIGYSKINAAYAYGGIKQAEATISQFLGIPIDHYVIVKVYSAEKIVDALGGVEVDVEKNMNYDDNWGHLHVHLKKGPQVLNGKQLVGYARFRHDAEGDRGRIRRQQQVIRALGRKLGDPSVLTRLPAIARIVKKSLKTDFTVPQLLALANLYRGFNFSNVRSGTIVGSNAVIHGIDYIIPYAPDNQSTIRRLLQDVNQMPKGDLRVEVLNGSHNSQAAAHMADTLNLQGLQVVHVGKADRSDYTRTEIIQHIKMRRARGILTHILPDATYLDASSQAGAPYDVTIIVGNDDPTADPGWLPPESVPAYTPPPQPRPQPAPVATPTTRSVPPPEKLPPTPPVPQEVPLRAPPPQPHPVAPPPAQLVLPSGTPSAAPSQSRGVNHPFPAPVATPLNPGG